MTEEQMTYACGTCGKAIKTGCYCSETCADADDPASDGHDPDLDENNVCRVCGRYEPE